MGKAKVNGKGNGKPKARTDPRSGAGAGPGGKSKRKLFGVRAVELGFTTEAQVLEALRFQYNAKILLGKHLFLGEVLLLQGAITTAQLARLLKETGEMHEEAEDSHRHRFFGDVAVELGFVTAKQVFDALVVQWEESQRGERHRLVGEILFERGYLSRGQVEQVVSRLVAGEPAGAT